MALTTLEGSSIAAAFAGACFTGLDAILFPAILVGFDVLGIVVFGAMLAAGVIATMGVAFAGLLTVVLFAVPPHAKAKAIRESIAVSNNSLLFIFGLPGPDLATDILYLFSTVPGAFLMVNDRLH